MALPNISFSPVIDIHLLWGLSIDLMNLLRIGTDSAANFRTANPGATITFTPFFKKTSGAGAEHSGPNITVNTQTGMVTTQVSPPGLNKKNFLVKTVVTLGAESKETYIRIHLHHTIHDAWLTPGILTVQQGIPGFRFSVRAHFDDGVVAEIGLISDGSPLPTNHNLFNIAWSHPVAGLVLPDSGLIQPNVITTNGIVPDPVTATITVPSLGLSVAATGLIKMDDSFSGNRSDITAELVTTGNCPGFAKAQEVPNILFMPDGFQDEDKVHFDLFVNEYVSRLTTGKITAPFDLLAGSINFWKAFVPSRERSVTTRSEVYLMTVNTKPVGVPFPNPVKPTRPDGLENLNATQWNYWNLYYHVGLPVRADVTRDNGSLRDEWKQNTLLTSAQVDAIPGSSITQWKNSGVRRLPEERDSILGLMINDYTAAANDFQFDMVVFNFIKRMNRFKLDKFLMNMKDSSGNRIGNFFVHGLTSSGLQGKDYDNVCFVTAATRARENNFDGGFFIAIREWQGYYKMESGSLTNVKVSVEVDTEIKELPLSKMKTLTHELAHSFALGDEYGESPPSDTFLNKFVNDPLITGSNWAFGRFIGGGNFTDWAGNLQARRDLLIMAPPGINANKIKWRYHRIERIGVVAEEISSSGNQHTVTLKQGQASAFAVGDHVFLRKRVQYSYSLLAEVSPGTMVPNQDVHRILPDSVIHTEGTILSVNHPSNQVTIRDIEGNVFMITLSIPNSSTLFQPNQKSILVRSVKREPIFSKVRTDPALGEFADTLILSLSQELKVLSVQQATNQVVVTPEDSNSLTEELRKLATGEVMILYKPMTAPQLVTTPEYKYAEVISKQVLDHLVTKPFAFNAKTDPSHGNEISEIVDRRAEQESSIPDVLVPSCSSQKKKIVGMYSGGSRFHGDVYHGTGKCFMRNEQNESSFDGFCMVCKYVLIDMIDPFKHGTLNARYPNKIYPDIQLDLTFIGGLPEM